MICPHPARSQGLRLLSRLARYATGKVRHMDATCCIGGVSVIRSGKDNDWRVAGADLAGLLVIAKQ